MTAFRNKETGLHFAQVILTRLLFCVYSACRGVPAGWTLMDRPGGLTAVPTGRQCKGRHRKEADTAVLLCTTGIGMSISANKVRGVRAARCLDEFDARAARSQFDANVLRLSGELLAENVPRKIVEVWLNTDFQRRERPKRLVRKIRSIEEGHDPRQVHGAGH